MQVKPIKKRDKGRLCEAVVGYDYAGGPRIIKCKNTAVSWCYGDQFTSFGLPMCQECIDKEKRRLEKIRSLDENPSDTACE